jgi:lysophospholipase L1-like esterase
MAHQKSWNSASANKMAELTVLMLGDSLLDGFLGSAASVPPSQRLQDLLCSELVPGESVAAEVFDMATPGILTRQLLDMFTHSAPDIPPRFDIAFILCGTNDLGSGKTPSQIADNLRELRAAVRRHSPDAAIVAITIPQSVHDIKSLLLTRAETNSLIRAQAGCEGCHVLDLHAMLPFDHYGRGWSAAYPDCDTPSLWHADGLHFSPLGYARIGELCFALIRDGKLAGAALARAQRPSQHPPS